MIATVKAIDEYYERQIEDPYRNLENPEDTTVIDWLKKQNQFARLQLDGISKKERLISLQKKFGNPEKDEIKSLTSTKNGQLFYLKRPFDKNYFALYYRSSVSSDEELLYDATNFLTTTKEKYSINYFKPNWDGSKLVISFIKNGEELSELRVLDLTTKKLLPLVISKCLPTYGGVYWLPDNSGFTYLKPSLNNEGVKENYLNMQVLLHTLDDSVTVLFSRAHNPKLEMKPEDIPVVLIEEQNNNYVISAVAGATSFHDYYYKPVLDVTNNKESWKPLFKKSDKVISYFQDRDSIVYLTADNASNFKICKTSMIQPDLKNAVAIVNEKENEVIKSFRLVKEGIIYTTTKNGVEAKLYLLKNNKETEEITLPFPAGKVSLTTHGKNKDAIEIRVRGWLSKERRYMYDFVTRTFKEADIVIPENHSFIHKIEVRELEVSSHDGVKVPLSIIHKKGISKNNSTPVFIVAYGAYGTSIQPMFTQKIMTWIHEGGIFAVAHIRGGGEKGDAWHKGGFKETKPNSWKDLIACSEYLIKEKYTDKGKIAINGASAGGITVGRAMTERPDLFGAVIANVGFMNTVRMEEGLNGANNTKEFGSVKNKDEFSWLLEMDSYHHIDKDVEYPATLITTGVNDARVPFWHSAKFAAKLQESTIGDTPILLKVGFQSGHGISLSKNKKLEDIADTLVFALWQTGHPDYQPKK
ncbi:hypothetical protein AB832_03850 [Flavobacteriaceae bacterium (ex Bugula neritina AB1)]|nr:hypothetical protein AB832_03850 [Flavobacteriaceae bacterium (ex Bugula neritina AB1)]